MTDSQNKLYDGKGKREASVIQNSLFDVTANRHKGAETSVAANARATPSKAYWRIQVLHCISSLKQATLKDVCTLLNRPANSLSGRVSELLASEQIEIVGRRSGFRIYRVKA